MMLTTVIVASMRLYRFFKRITRASHVCCYCYGLAVVHLALGGADHAQQHTPAAGRAHANVIVANMKMFGIYGMYRIN
jgi:hypothetical protein